MATTLNKQSHLMYERTCICIYPSTHIIYGFGLPCKIIWHIYVGNREFSYDNKAYLWYIHGVIVFDSDRRRLFLDHPQRNDRPVSDTFEIKRNPAFLYRCSGVFHARHSKVFPTLTKEVLSCRKSHAKSVITHITIGKI